MDVTTYLEPRIDLERLATVLDGLGHEGRVHTMRTWAKRDQARLFEAAKGFRAAELDFLVPPSVGPLTAVVHVGFNSLPLFTSFEKHFTRTEAGSVVGYNEQVWAWFSGPGYFTARAGDGEHAGELVIDYETLPTEKAPPWPEIRRNDSGTAALVYGGKLIDYVRPISRHVSIAWATKHGKHSNWFALVRQDLS